MRIRISIGLGAAALLACAGARARAQAAPPRPVFSIGQPSLWNSDAALLAPIHGAQPGAALIDYRLGRSVTNPLTGLLSGAGEAYAAIGARSYGLRLLAESKTVGLSGGLDWSIAMHRLSPIVSFQTAIRRGGLLGAGTMARIDWLPTRSQTLAIGISVPLFRPLAGRTRPRRTHFAFPGRSGAAPTAPASVDTRELAAAAHAIGAYSNAYSRTAERIIATEPDGYTSVLGAYDRALTQLFAAGADSSHAARVATRARAALLEHVLMPADSMFGEAKENPRDLSPLTNAATVAFARWLSDSSGVPRDRDAALTGRFSAWMQVVTDVYRELLAESGDSKLVWLPLDLALTPDQFDEQSEVDSLVARAVGHPFTDRNALTYLRSVDLPLEIARSIYATRDYHVLWTHDFTGRRPTGSIDNVAYSMVADAYLPALTAAVKRYDTTGVFPTYIILQDEFFYADRDNRLWMNILQDPLHASMHLPGDTSNVREAHLLDRQRELRAAVAASARLQRDAAASGNANAWLRRIVAVHVNIVEPGDFSFRSSHIIPGLPFTPDNIERDHRKLVFYDLNDADPYKGALLIMGVGIGEHYASATWEDRGYRVRGPATLEARRAVREALRRNGFSEADIPVPLRAVASAKAEEQRMNAGDYVGRALQVHNRVGFAPKQSSVARAMLYDLAPPGSVIIVPDPMWLSDTWAGMLAGAAARGCRVYVVAPAAANAPSPQGPLMALQNEVLGRLLQLRQSLSSEIRSSGGDLRVGIFAAHAPVDDAGGRAREVREGLARAPWIRQVIPFDDKTLAFLNQAEAQATHGKDATSLAHDQRPREPQLHQKSQFIARPGAITALVRQPGWDVVLARSIQAQSEETAKFAEQLGYSNPDVDTAATRSTDAMFRGYEQSLPESERRRVSFYFSLGTQNEDPRGIVSDGEATLIVSGMQASAGLVDLFYLMARSTWIDDQRALDALVPRHTGLVRRLAWFVRDAF
ncbi:MAG TPA: hypothetical protein VHB25_01895 [Gemmatimonadaceae bacterium]|nr:hypothetical protein [Gemmatimonadaceae bacterium]